jgi:hypothetical protein
MSTFMTPGHWKMFGKPSRRELALEIDRLNAALSSAAKTQLDTERLWREESNTATTLSRALSQVQRKLEEYDEGALAEARRLVVLQIFGGYVPNINETVEWLATGTWTATDDAQEVADFTGEATPARPTEPAESGIARVAVEGEAYRQDMLANYQNGFVAGREERIYDPTPLKSTQSNAYAHGYVKGWNELLDKIQARLRDESLPWPDDQFEHLRHSFNRTEAM